ncbi:hypothetical protein ILUMI_15542 [Ignelater luminosus]|uniref:Uncharacterized protein n=1 Tax=Ignelater luminosus TaxID=2038154 RepID=A0A8K0CS21_IGNLU|nr:hypothetical protein ILUMI_15542 [Ignelater luminosus]
MSNDVTKSKSNCCASQCKSTYKIPNISFHKFPKLQQNINEKMDGCLENREEYFCLHENREQRLQNRAKNKSVQKAVEHVEELPDLTAGWKCYDTIEAARNLLNFKESSAVFSRTPVEIKKTCKDKGVQVNTYDDFTSYSIENLMDSDYKCRILTGVINPSNIGPRQVLSCPFCYQIIHLVFFDSSY